MGVKLQQLSDTDGFQIRIMVLWTVNVSLEVSVPRLLVSFAVCLAAPDVILDEFGVLLVEAVRRIGMPPVRSLDHAVGISDCRHEGVLTGDRIRHDALGLEHDPVGGAREPTVAKTGPEMLSVAVG